MRGAGVHRRGEAEGGGTQLGEGRTRIGVVDCHLVKDAMGNTNRLITRTSEDMTSVEVNALY